MPLAIGMALSDTALANDEPFGVPPGTYRSSGLSATWCSELVVPASVNEDIFFSSGHCGDKRQRTISKYVIRGKKTKFSLNDQGQSVFTVSPGYFLTATDILPNGSLMVRWEDPKQVLSAMIFSRVSPGQNNGSD